MSLIDRQAPLIEELAAGLGCEGRALRAVLRVESPGEGLANGRPLVRLEVHHLWEAVSKAQRPAVDARFHVDGPRAWEGHRFLAPLGQHAGLAWVPLHQPGPGGQAIEWEALTVARAIDERAAIESTSWGAGQVLGCYWMQLGYASPTMFAAAMGGEPAQLRAVAGAIRIVAGVRALVAKDWRSFARAYNGPGQVEWYAGRLAEAYARN